MGLTGDILLLGALVILSAFFSGVETAFTSLSEIRIQHLMETDPKKFGLVSTLKANAQRLLITILIGNNLTNIGASALAANVAVEIFPHWGLGLAIGIMTFTILVFGEVTPKTLALAKNEWICVQSAPTLRLLQWFFHPVIVFLEWIAKGIGRPIKVEEDAPVITEDEIKTVVDMGEEAGEVEEDERRWIHNIFRFSDMQASEIMTDRTQFFSVNAELTVRDVAPEIVQKGFSRIPVYEDKPDKMAGILYARDILEALITGQEDSTVKTLARPAMFVPQTVLVDDLLREFQARKVHMALVVDEHGGVSGLITIEDLLEEIVGEIVDETDKEPDLIKKVSPDKALVKGETEVEAVNQELKLDLDEHAEFETISGFILSELRRIPQVGEEIPIKSAVIRITKADQQRIIEVEIEKSG